MTARPALLAAFILLSGCVLLDPGAYRAWLEAHDGEPSLDSGDTGHQPDDTGQPRGDLGVAAFSSGWDEVGDTWEYQAWVRGPHATVVAFTIACSSEEQVLFEEHPLAVAQQDVTQGVDAWAVALAVAADGDPYGPGVSTAFSPEAAGRLTWMITAEDGASGSDCLALGVDPAIFSDFGCHD